MNGVDNVNYLKPLIPKLTKDADLMSKVSKFKNDAEIMDIISKVIAVEDIENVFNQHYGIKYSKLNVEDVDLDLSSKFDEKFLRESVVLPVQFDEEKSLWTFVVSNITNRNIQAQVKNAVSQVGQRVQFNFAFDFEIKMVYDYIDMKKGGGLESPDSVSKGATEWVNTIINDGVKLGASDIHIERQKTGINVRYRVDGSMTGQRFFTMDETEISNIYVRLKVIGNMDISEKRRSQDGRIDHYEYNGKSYSLRVSTINTINGEKFVMRIVAEDEMSADFNELGFTKEKEELILKMIRRPNGIIYLAGATGSGKTTTLYAMINSLDRKNLNIYTIENPAEKSIEHVNQVQVDEASGNTYPSVLKTLLRQDPDVIVVGEVREVETSRLAVQASLTGHLVMTTIHANSSLDSISRLLDMGVEPYLIGASSVGFISQRLVKVLCPHCKEKVEHLPEYQKNWIQDEVKDFDYEKLKSNGQYIYKNCGCDKCVNGYKGRVAILEIIVVDDELRSLISKNADAKEMKDYLDSIGYEGIKKDGLQKAFNGLTSIEELMGKLQS